MSRYMMYAVITTNQASGQPDSEADLYHDRDNAVEWAQHLAAATRDVGRRERHYVVQIEPMNEWTQIDADGNEVEW